MRKIFSLATIIVISTLSTGCSMLSSSSDAEPANLAGSEFLQSGTIVVSYAVPTTSAASINKSSSEEAMVLAPLIGYFPPAAGYLPAENETWLQLEQGSNAVTLMKGESVIKEMTADGKVNLEPGKYLLRKTKNPKWYAPDEYFAKRQLETPEKNSSTRFRRGALGKYAIYPEGDSFPSISFPIHSGPVWTEEVGGLRLSNADLSSIYYMLPVGSAIVVR